MVPLHKQLYDQKIMLKSFHSHHDVTQNLCSHSKIRNGSLLQLCVTTHTASLTATVNHSSFPIEGMANLNTLMCFYKNVKTLQRSSFYADVNVPYIFFLIQHQKIYQHNSVINNFHFSSILLLSNHKLRF